MIVICEPMFWGFEHARFNAAFIATVAEAFPEEGLLFLAEAGHVRYVKNILDAHSVVVRYRETTTPPRTLLDYQRFVPNFRLCRNVFQLAHKNHANTIIFCSVTTPGLISTKALLRRYRDIVCLVVPHDILQDVTWALPLLPHRRFFSFRLWISFGNTYRLRYVVLGPHIEKRLKQYIPRVSSYVSSVDFPYFFRDEASPEPFAGDAIRFGTYGIGTPGKGTDIFFKLAEEVRSTKTTYKPTFTLIGHLDTKMKDVPHRSVNIPSPDVPMDQEAYEKYGRCIDYDLFLNRPNSYELRASGAILDAFSSLNPVIALKSPLSEYYFNKMGDIGYLCENSSAVKDTILDILETRPIERYRQQQENILKQRVQFSPASVSVKFRNLLQATMQEVDL
ncbi:MAG: hypothetical protein ACXVI0_09775 [Halobacteriota archaeon]